MQVICRIAMVCYRFGGVGADISLFEFGLYAYLEDFPFRKAINHVRLPRYGEQS